MAITKPIILNETGLSIAAALNRQADAMDALNNGSVHFDRAQDLTDTQKATARDNIGAASTKYVDDSIDAITLSNCYDIIAKYHGDYPSRTDGVTITYLDDGGIRIWGVANSISWANLYMDATKLPDGLVPGRRYYITYAGVKARLVIYEYDGSSTVNVFDQLEYNNYWTAPQTMDGKGCIVRVWLAANQTYDEVVYPAIYTDKPNGVLADEIEQTNTTLAGDIANVNTALTSNVTRIDTALTAHGNAIGDLKKSVELGNCYSILPKYLGDYASREDGVTITYQDDGGIRIQGTTTGVSFANLYMDSTKLPDGLIPGKRYYIAYTGVKAKLIIYSYASGGEMTNLLETTDYNGYWTAPAALEGTGAIVRVWLASGQTYDEVVYPAIYTEMPNSELTRDVPYVDSLARNAPINFIDVTDKSSVTHSGVTYDWLSNGTCHVHGTATATSYANIFISRSALPDWMDKAYTYEINCSSESVYLYVYDYTTSSPTVLGYSRQGLTKTVKIPETCTGIIIRLWIASGTTVDEIVEASMMRSGRDMDGIVAYVGNANEYTSDANDIDRNCSVFVSLANGAPDIANVPYGAGWLDTYIVSNAIRMQRLTPYEPQKNPVMIRTKTPSGWEAWVAVGQRGYVEAVDTASADETGKTDMRAAIQYALDTYHYCKLGPGAYYVSSAVRMPQGSTLEGCGESTEIRLMSGNAKVAVMMTKYCTINNLCVFGSYTDLAEADFGETSGTRHGIYYYKGSDDPWNTAYCAITNVHIRNFTGNGIYQYNTGANVEQGVFVSNVHIKNCWCGIHNYFKSEFCRYENVQITYCYIACINDGGNNSFNNCVFHAYTIGMRIDGIRNNSAHGMCSNSSFCHIGGNKGSALTLTDIVNGYVFSACQFWYNSVDITNCGGIVFSGCEFGKGVGVTDPDTGESYTGATIRIVDNNTVMFNGCVFMNDVNDVAVITATNGDKVKIDACYGSVSGKTIHLGIND